MHKCEYLADRSIGDCVVQARSVGALALCNLAQGKGKQRVEQAVGGRAGAQPLFTQLAVQQAEGQGQG
mgnify:CR=1 FL=1